MDHVEHVFAALSQRMNCLSVPQRTPAAPDSIAGLIEKVNAAKRLYEPGALRR